MEQIDGLIKLVQENWLSISVALLAFDQFLFVVSPLTPWKWDDTLSGKLRVFLKKLPIKNGGKNE